MLKKVIVSIINRLPPKKIVFFESAPDLSDNTKAVFDEMLRRRLNDKYKLYWVCFDDTKKAHKGIKNVKYLSSVSLMTKYLIKRAKCVISCNRFVTSSNNNSFNIYLCHGNPLKNTKNYYVIPEEMHCILASSIGMRNLRASFYGYDLRKFVVLGYPRNDVMTNSHIDLHNVFAQDFNKVIAWYPTVREFKDGMSTGSANALPIIWSEEKALELNACAKDCRLLIVLKPHFAQKIDNLKVLNLSNIVFIDDLFFIENNITSYQFVGNCDALLTDFSSIYYDYTLCDKPIGLIWEDYEQYKSNPGFAVDMNKMMKGGIKIYNLKDLEHFIRDVSNGIDRLKTERREIRDFSNVSTDGNNSSRVVDFIVQKLKHLH